MVKMIRENLCYGVVCTDVNPEDKDAFDRVDKELKQIPSGTENGWRTVRPDEKEYKEIVKCEEGGYHYLVVT